MLSHLLQPIDVVCERTAAGLGAEPLNALTALAYTVLALWLWPRLRPHFTTLPELPWLLGCLGLIGAGSFAAHTLSLQITHAINGFLTVAFIALYVWAVGRRAWGWAPLAAAGGALVMLLLMTGAGWLAGSYHAQTQLPYVPLWLLLLALAWQWRGHVAGRWQATAVVCFAVGILLHNLDLRLCPVWPYGTHFLWHLTNDITLTCLLLALTHQGTQRRPGKHRR